MNPEHLSLSEIAKSLGVSPATISNWQKRFPNFPPPVATRGQRGLYRLADIKAFIARNDLQLAKENIRETREQRAVAALRRFLSKNEVDQSDALLIILYICGLYFMEGGRSLLLGSRKANSTPKIFGIEGVNVPRNIILLLDKGAFWQELIEIWLGEDLGTEPNVRKRMHEVLHQLLIKSLRSGGQYETSDSLARLVNRIGRGLEILDIACGVGSVLDTYAESARTLIGQDINEQALFVNQMLDIVRNGKLTRELLHGDSLTEFRQEWLGVFDVVVCHPPFGVFRPVSELDQFDPRWTLFDHMDKRNTTDSWIQTLLAYLRPGGSDAHFRGIFVTTENWLLAGSEKRMRNALLRLGHIEAVISLGTKMSHGTSVAIYLVIFRKQGSASQPVRMIDGSALGEVKHGVRVLTEEEIEAIVRILNGSRFETDGFTHIKVPFRDVHLTELLQNESVLSPRRYFETKASSENPSDILDSISAMINELDLQLRQLAEAVKRVKLRDEVTGAISLEDPVQFVQLGDTPSHSRCFDISYKNRMRGEEWKPSDIEDADFVVCMVGPLLGQAMRGSEFTSRRIQWPRIAQIRVNEEKLSRMFFEAWLFYGGFRHQVDRLSGGSTLRAISRKELERVIVPIPPRSAQDSIASIAAQISAMRRTIEVVQSSNSFIVKKLEELIEVLLDALTNPDQ
jgi:SAM-dependent methyltransferase/transcriptional regulator with XRE-family HTH domain